jgi:hypothetical protein
MILQCTAGDQILYCPSGVGLLIQQHPSVYLLPTPGERCHSKVPLKVFYLLPFYFIVFPLSNWAETGISIEIPTFLRHRGKSLSDPQATL